MFLRRFTKKILRKTGLIDKTRSSLGLFLTIMIITIDSVSFLSVLGYLNYTSYFAPNITVYSTVLLLLSSITLFQIWFLGPGELKSSAGSRFLNSRTGRGHSVNDIYVYDASLNKYITNPITKHILTLTYIGRKNAKSYFLFNLYKFIYHVYTSYTLFNAFLYDELLYGFDLYFFYIAVIQLYQSIGSFFCLHSLLEFIVFLVKFSSSIYGVKYKNMGFIDSIKYYLGNIYIVLIPTPSIIELNDENFV